MAHPVRSALVARAGSFALGGLVGAVGTAAHRAYPPLGLLGCLALVLVAAVLCRAWAGLVGLVAFAIGWIAVVQILSLTGPGGDVLIPAGQVVGYAWVVGGMVAVGVAAFTPQRWYSDELAVRPATTAPQSPAQTPPARPARTRTKPEPLRAGDPGA